MCCSVYVSRSSQARIILFCACVAEIILNAFFLNLICIAAMALNLIALLLMLKEPFFFVMRKTSFTAAISFVLLLDACASALMLWQTIVTSYEKSSGRASNAQLASFSLSTAFDLIDIFVIGAMLGRGSDVDVGLKRLVLYGNAGAFLAWHLGLLYRISTRH